MNDSQFQSVTLDLVSDINGTLAQVNSGIADNNDNSNNLVLGVTALVVSLIALVSTILQVIQQYLASATDGYRRCTHRVIGRWADRTSRKYRWTEVRFEVKFETPVIFLAPPTNKRGPMGTSSEHEIINLDGSDSSYGKANLDIFGWTKPIHTANDEMASWVTLLEAIQFEEKDSCQWELNRRIEQSKAEKPPKPGQATAKETSFEERVIDNALICHQIQKKERSWDFMPPSTSKPFATTTLCHLVEMVALLGMYWRQFDVQRGGLAAEGNGYVFSSSMVWGLGLQMYFAVTGSHAFRDRRVIPCDAVKSLVFGIVPSILDRPLKLGTTDNVLRTLATFNCSPATIESYGKAKKRTYMFSIAFEIIALLAKPFRLKGSMMRMLPNPTADAWLGDISKISWVDAMEHFQQKLTMLDNSNTEVSKLLQEIKTQWSETEHEWNEMKKNWEERKMKVEADKAKKEENDKGKKMDNDKSKTVEKDKTKKAWKYNMENVWKDKTKRKEMKKNLQDTWYEEKEDKELPADFAPKMTIKLRDQLHKGLDSIHAVFKKEHIETPEICSVVASHLGSVLYEAAGLEATITKKGDNSAHNMIDYYFDHVRPSVMWEGVLAPVVSATTRDAAAAAGGEEQSPTTVNTSRQPSVAFFQNAERRESGIAPLITELREGAAATTAAAAATMPATEDERKAAERRSAIWVSLVFRMISWSLLHDFDPNDINRVPSELVGSRMPVFIG